MDLSGIKVIEFSGDSCANCITLMPILSRLVSQYEDVELLHVEVEDKNKEIVEHFKVDTLPTIIITKDGVEKARSRGFQIEEILSLWLDAKLDDIRKE